MRRLIDRLACRMFGHCTVPGPSGYFCIACGIPRRPR